MFAQIREYYQRLAPEITDEEWEVLENMLTFKSLQKGEFLIKEGEVCNHVSFISSGLLRMYMNSNGLEVSLGFVGTNEYISSYESFLTRSPSLENIDAIENTTLIQLNFDNMQILYNKKPIYQKVGRKIAEQLFIWLNQRSSALLLLTPEQRYDQMIENNPYLLQSVPQYMLATYIGITPRHLSRIRKQKLGK